MLFSHVLSSMSFYFNYMNSRGWNTGQLGNHCGNFNKTLRGGKKLTNIAPWVAIPPRAPHD